MDRRGLEWVLRGVGVVGTVFVMVDTDDASSVTFS